MKRWYWSAAAVLGLSGAGVLFGWDRSRRAGRQLRDRLEEAPERLEAIHSGIAEEIQSIRASLGQVARTLGKDAEQILQ